VCVCVCVCMCVCVCVCACAHLYVFIYACVWVSTFIVLVISACHTHMHTHSHANNYSMASHQLTFHMQHSCAHHRLVTPTNTVLTHTAKTRFTVYDYPVLARDHSTTHECGYHLLLLFLFDMGYISSPCTAFQNPRMPFLMVISSWR